jgi:hypothetical protein
MDRANAGLPLRDDLGWTPEELRILEAKRHEMMMAPIYGRLVLPAEWKQ